MTLILHCGADMVTSDDLKMVETPAATATHTPIPHIAIVDRVITELNNADYTVVESGFGLNKDGDEMFALLEIENKVLEKNGYGHLVGLRNSHNKAFAASIAFGSRVFVCDNLAFHGEYVLSRKHTSDAELYFNALAKVAVEKLTETAIKYAFDMDMFEAQTIDSERELDHIIMSACRRKIIGRSKLMNVYETFRDDVSATRYGHDDSYWRLYNSFTEVMKPRSNSGMVKLPRQTMALLNYLKDTIAPAKYVQPQQIARA